MTGVVSETFSRPHDPARRRRKNAKAALYDGVGIRCPHCLSSRRLIIDSRPADYGVKRRSRCTDCNGRFTTVEITETEQQDAIGAARQAALDEVLPGWSRLAEADQALVGKMVGSLILRLQGGKP